MKDRFLQAEIRAIEIAKWRRGEEIHSDPGEGYVTKWVEQFAKEFRDRWPDSKCATCVCECGYECKSFCDQYRE